MIGVVGAGSIGQRHIKNLIALGVSPSDIVAYDEREVQVTDGVKFCRVPSGIPVRDDVLVICTPADTHSQTIKDAINHKIPFFVEKPATTGLSQLTKDEWETSVPHLVGCNMRWRRELIELREMALKSRYTKISMSLRMDISKWPGLRYAAPVFEMCHEIDLARWMIGDLRLIMSWGDQRSFDLDMGSKRGRVVINVDSFAGGYHRSWSVETDSGETKKNEWKSVPDDLNEMYQDEMAHFLAVVDRKALSVNMLRDARNVVEVCEMAFRLQDDLTGRTR